MSTIKCVCLLILGLLLAPAAHASDRQVHSSDVTSPVSVVASTSVLNIDAGSCSTPVRYSVVPGSLPEGGSYDVTATLRNSQGLGVGSDSSSMEDGASYRGESPRVWWRLSIHGG